ncbi:thiol reductant ABC exporter subunit CydC [Propionicicella superfundia]|uniref:thiol reductant ABC exporter subunit CydC n=1 Tax=Propionicicella superfundia TaxID=348582 RepID=UPI00041F2C93|nr:thiol reductant ABC exporter subunit CydC [Propionicicella superfundia]
MSAPAAAPPRRGWLGLLRGLTADVPRAWPHFFAALLLAAAASAASVALMATSGWLLSRAAEHPPVLYLQVAAVGVRFFGISRGVFRYTERLVGHDLALKLQSALRLRVYGTLSRTTLLGRRRGDLLTRIVADVEAVMDLVVRVLVPFCSASLVILATTTLFAVFSPASAIVLLVSAVLAGGIVPWVAQRASRAADATAVPARGRLADSAHELSRASVDIVAYGLAEERLAALLDVDEELKRAEERAAVVRGIAVAGQVVAAGFAVLLILVLGAQEVAAGTLSPVMLAVLVLTPLTLHEVLSTLAQSAQTFTRAKVALRRVEAELTAEPVGAGDVPDAPPAEDPGLRLSGATIGWPRSEALLTGLDLRVGRGERVALVGPSGVGKTTVAATVMGLIPPQAGRVETHGRVGYLAQDAHIFSTTVSENVRIGNKDATRDDVVHALARAGLDLDPDRVVGELGSAVSGGEARRIALARLLVGDYQVWVLDEPTEHLDVITAAGVLDDLWRAAGDAPLLAITHDPAVMERCDRVVRLAR